MPIAFDWSKTISELPGNPVPAEWIENRGKGVKVAFIDTGVNLGLPALAHLNQQGRKFFTGAPGFSVAKLVGQDAVGEVFGGLGQGHGTLYASLLAGKSIRAAENDDKDWVTGIANAAEYYIIKARNPNDKKTTIRNLLDALELSANLGIEVAITGQCISTAQMPFEAITLAELDRVFNLVGVKNMFIFAPLKNLEPTDPWGGITADNFPSLRSEIFNVAKLPDNIGDVSSLLQTLPIPFFLSGFSGEVLSKNGTAVEMNFSNSGAVAILGGIAVLAVSDFKQKNSGALPSRDGLQKLLAARCKPLAGVSAPPGEPTFFKNF